jgi:hypothetical protein
LTFAHLLKAMLAERAESERLRQIIKELQRHRSGWRAETLPEEQLQFGLEDVCESASERTPPKIGLAVQSAPYFALGWGPIGADWNPSWPKLSGVRSAA